MAFFFKLNLFSTHNCLSTVPRQLHFLKPFSINLRIYPLLLTELKIFLIYKSVIQQTTKRLTFLDLTFDQMSSKFTVSKPSFESILVKFKIVLQLQNVPKSIPFMPLQPVFMKSYLCALYRTRCKFSMYKGPYFNYVST